MQTMFVGPFELLMILTLSGGFGLPLGVPPGPEDPLLANVAPETCLFYTSWAATAAPDPAGPNRTEQLLAEPEIQRAVSAIEQAAAAAVRRAADEQDPHAAALCDLFEMGQPLLARPGAIFVSELNVRPGGPPDVRGAALVRVGKEEGAKLKAMLQQQQAALLDDAVEEVEIAGEIWYRITLDPALPTITWGMRGSYLVLGLGEGSVEGVLQRARSAPPKWLADLRAALPVERPATYTYVNVKAIAEMAAETADPEVAAVLRLLGLDNVQYAAAVSGLDGDGFLSRSLLGVDGDPEGVVALLAGEPLAAADLDPVPRDATFAAAIRLDAEKVLDLVLAIAEHEGDPHVAGGIAELERELGVDLRSDVFGPLGDRWRLYGSPSEMGIVPLGAVAVVRVDDHATLAAAHAKLLDFAKSQLSPEEWGPAAPRIDQFEHAGRTIHLFNARSPDMPLAPAWCLTEEELIVSLFPQGIKAYLSREPGAASLAQSPEVATAFDPAGGPTALFYVDSKRVFELIYPAFPMLAQVVLSEAARQGIDLNVSIVPSAPAIGKHLRPGVATLRRTPEGLELASRQTLPGGSVGPAVPMAVGLALPAVSAARQAARRAQSSNNLRHIALAMHNYHMVHRSFPPAYIADEAGKPLLSWRVLLLPYLEQAHLYDQFKLDEPWDSEHNKRLIESMPETYRSPAGTADPGMTNYLTVRGKETAFPGAEGVRFADIRDGTSNTIMAVEVDDAKAVPWTKPDDFAHDSDRPMAGLGGLWPDGFLVIFCDGAVRFLQTNLDRRILNALFTIAGGEVVDWSEF